MTLYEFNILNDNNQYQAVWDNGTFIDSVTSEGFKMAYNLIAFLSVDSIP